MENNFFLCFNDDEYESNTKDKIEHKDLIKKEREEQRETKKKE
jgi:hypothetical protein